MTDTYEPTDELRKAFMDAFEPAWDNGWFRDGLDAGLRAIAPILIKEGMERAAKVVDARVPLLSEKQANAFAGGNGQSGYLFHAKHCEALDIASAIRAAKEG